VSASTNRRSLLRGVLSGALTAGAGASVAAIPVLAAAEGPDPIFGVIEARKAAEHRIDELRDMGDRVAYQKATRAADAASVALTETPPTGLPGMRALLEFLDEWCGGNNGDYFEYSLLLRSPLLA
jgi:hypothetical protein